MKQRVLSAIVGLGLLAVVLLFYRTIVLNFAISFFMMISVYEVLHAIGIFPRHIGVFAVCGLFGISFPFLNMPDLWDVRVVAVIVFMIALFLILLKNNAALRVEQVSLAALSTVTISFCMTVLIYLRDKFGMFALFYIVLLFSIAWICDAGAYFFGRAFGRHKLCPNISPNKTIEGAIGGVIINCVFVSIVIAVFQLWVFPGAVVSYGMVAVITLLGSAVAIVGDLFASAVKRQYKIKDFGNLIPGHGGAVDRFDSFMLTAIVFYAFVCYFPLISA